MFKITELITGRVNCTTLDRREGKKEVGRGEKRGEERREKEGRGGREGKHYNFYPRTKHPSAKM